MIDSPDKEYEIFIDKFKKIVEKDKLALTNDDDYLYVKNENGDICQISFSKNEFLDEFQNVTDYEDHKIRGENSFNALLYDFSKKVESDIKLEGGIKGYIKRNFKSYYSIFCKNISTHRQRAKIT